MCLHTLLKTNAHYGAHSIISEISDVIISNACLRVYGQQSSLLFMLVLHPHSVVYTIVYGCFCCPAIHRMFELAADSLFH